MDLGWYGGTLQDAPRHGAGRDLVPIPALPCMVAEGTSSWQALDLSQVTEEPWNDTQLTSPV